MTLTELREEAAKLTAPPGKYFEHIFTVYEEHGLCVGRGSYKTPIKTETAVILYEALCVGGHGWHLRARMFSHSSAESTEARRNFRE